MNEGAAIAVVRDLLEANREHLTQERCPGIIPDIWMSIIQRTQRNGKKLGMSNQVD